MLCQVRMFLRFPGLQYGMVHAMPIILLTGCDTLSALLFIILLFFFLKKKVFKFARKILLKRKLMRSRYWFQTHTAISLRKLSFQDTVHLRKRKFYRKNLKSTVYLIQSFSWVHSWSNRNKAFECKIFSNITMMELETWTSWELLIGKNLFCFLNFYCNVGIGRNLKSNCGVREWICEKFAI